MANFLRLKWNIPEARSTEDTADLEARQALQDNQGLVEYRLGPFDLGMMCPVAIEHRIEGLGAACTAVEVPKSAAEVPSMECSDVVNQSYRNHHGAACQFYPSFQHSICPWQIPNWLSKFRYHHLLQPLSNNFRGSCLAITYLRHSPLSCRKCAHELACRALLAPP